MQVLYPRCAGLDVHKKTVTACRVQPGSHGQVIKETATFGTTTAELLRLADWLAEEECSHVVMESTGEYWRPVYNLLEGQCEVLLANPLHVRKVPGRKTDVGDAEWLAELLRHGLIAPSFVPSRPQRDLRDLTRTRNTLVQERARVANRIQKVLEDANIKLASVVSDIQGVSARSMLAALVAEEEDPAALAELARGRLRSRIPELQEALEGCMRQHHRLLLSHHLAHLDFLDQEVAAFSQAVAEQVARMSEESSPTVEGPTPSCGLPNPSNVDPQTGQVLSNASHDLKPLNAVEAIALLDTIPGVGREVAEAIVAEAGTDMSRFPSADHLAAWAGLAPGNNESAGKRYSGRTRKGNRVLRATLTQSASAVARIRNPNYLTAQYHHLVGRRGKKRATVAVAHSIIVIAYHMLKRHQPYQDLGGDYYDRRKKAHLTRHLTRRLEQLGYIVDLKPLANAAAAA